MSTDAWVPFDDGKTMGQTGSEQGVIIADEEYKHGARITLERNTRIAPYAITCGMYGGFFHTRFFSTEDEGQTAYDEMKVGLAQLVDIPIPEDDDKYRAYKVVTDAIGEFVKKFP